MAADTMEALGIPRGSYVVKVNNRKVLDGVMESIGIGGDANAGKRLTVLRAIDKLDRLGMKGVRELLGEGRKDESGDFTKGAGLSQEQTDKVLVLFEIASMSAAARASNFEFVEGVASGQIDLRGAEDIRAKGIFGGIAHNLLGSSVEGLAELQEIWKLLRAGEYDDGRVRIDPSVVRGLEYYTGPVYEVELLLDTKDEKGRPVRFGSVGGGGRYDGLVSRFRGEPVPATGFSIGVSRLQAALTLLGKLDAGKEFGPVVVTVFDRDRVADYQKMVALLRKENIRAELYLGNPKNMGNQLKYADRRNSPCVIIQGSDEKARGEVQIKDLIEGAKAAAAIASNHEWRETRPAQFSCSEDEIVAKVRDVLARHDVKWG
jgi:histidyl-tRNA synthetase